MTERVIQREHPERIVYGGSDLWESCMKTIPELRAEEVNVQWKPDIEFNQFDQFNWSGEI
jgi:hypothetical protein